MNLQFIPYLICSWIKDICFIVLQGEKGSVGPPGESGTSGQAVSNIIVVQ